MRAKVLDSATKQRKLERMSDLAPPDFLFVSSGHESELLRAEGLQVPQGESAVVLFEEYDDATTEEAGHRVIMVEAARMFHDGHQVIWMAQGMWEVMEIPPQYLWIQDII